MPYAIACAESFVAPDTAFPVGAGKADTGKQAAIDWRGGSAQSGEIIGFESQFGIRCCLTNRPATGLPQIRLTYSGAQEVWSTPAPAKLESLWTKAVL